MAELILEPFAARLRWSFAQPMEGEAWGVVLCNYLETIARRCAQSSPCVIGHIKAFAPLPGGYVRVNVTSPREGADFEAHHTEPCAELLLTLNVLVYGPRSGDLADLVAKAAAEVAATHGGSATQVERE